MEFNKINDAITVSGQITPEEVKTLAEKGFKILICNRPDQEIGPEMSSEVMAEAAAEAGLAFHYLPVVPGMLTQDLIEETARILEAAEGPVYAYCRSGTRSCNVWGLSQAGKEAADRIIEQGAGAGYDLNGLRPHLGD
ncbi:TIGR01244 family sulfur transferase [Celeribacter litoreus]|uniref:TIGR01244 family sulfur transferase n=1 Tax=Celeribacter litoreus TaxID=2876714 RepID=UPI001CCE042E|nr:TIGR01244 family sulfur transferase [Celeribacter litoreus]MCA0043639.1 TIGR01244 family phosphatase [Celeribacter litoreus]